MFKALVSGIGKKKPPSEDLIKKHREQKQTKDEWQAKLKGIRDILKTLRDSYARCKGNLMFNRYEELKDMIKLAAKQYEDFLEWEKSTVFGKQPGQGDRSDKQSRTGLGAISRLRHSAMGFATHQDSLCRDEKSYAERTTKSIEEEMEQCRHEVMQIKQEYRQAKETLERLKTEYQDSKKYNPSQRYNVLKTIIKEATRQS